MTKGINTTAIQKVQTPGTHTQRGIQLKQLQQGKKQNQIVAI